MEGNRAKQDKAAIWKYRAYRAITTFLTRVFIFKIKNFEHKIRSKNHKNIEYLMEFRTYFGHLSNPDNFVDGVYYHQANSFEENILRMGLMKIKLVIH